MLGAAPAGSFAGSSAHPPIQAKEEAFQSPTDVSDVGVSNALLHDPAPLGAGTTFTAQPLGTAHRFDANGNTRSNAYADASIDNGKFSASAAENSGERNAKIVPEWLLVPIEAADSTLLHNAPATPFAIVNEAPTEAGKTANIGLNDDGTYGRVFYFLLIFLHIISAGSSVCF